MFRGDYEPVLRARKRLALGRRYKQLLPDGFVNECDFAAGRPRPLNVGRSVTGDLSGSNAPEAYPIESGAP